MKVHSIVPTTAISSAKQGLRSWHGDSTRYSAGKFLAYQRYCRDASPMAVAWALVLTPLVGLVGAIAPSFVPLQDPMLGPTNNVGFWGNLYVTVVIISLGLLMHVQAGAEIPRELYTVKETVIISLVVSGLHVPVCYALARLWTFPIPEMWVSTISVWVAMLFVTHVVVLWKKLRASNEILVRALRYMPALIIQCTQVVVYPAFSILFRKVDTGYQIFLTLVFPLIKYGMKRVLRRFARGLNDYSSEVAVSGVEICAALYQSMIMQSAPSKVAMGIILGLDVLQGVVSIKLFMDKPTTMPKKELFEFAYEKLEAETKEARATSSSHKDERWISSRTETAEQDETAKSIGQALHLMHVAESHLLVEYFEVAIPTMNAFFLLLASTLPTAVYNDRLCRYFYHKDELAQAVLSTVLYSVLQGLTLVALHFVLQIRYGISGVRLLAFVLHWHRHSIWGKLLAWVPLILHFTLIHYGTDFTFTFDYHTMMSELKQCGQG